MSKSEKGAEGAKKTRRRKKKWLKIAIPVAIVLVAVLFLNNMSKSTSPGVLVYTDKVIAGEIETKLNTSGKVKAENTKTFFAPADAKVEGIEVGKGDIVKAGDILICFDDEAVAYAKRQSELEVSISAADYNSNIEFNQEQQQKLALAEVAIIELEQDIDNYEAYIEQLTNGITDVTALRKADLYAKIYSIEKEINNYDLAIQTPNEDTDMSGLLRKKTDKQNELNQLNNELNLLSDYKTDYGWEDLLTQAKKDLADCETKLAEAKSDKASAEASIMNGDKMASFALNKQKTQLVNEDAGKKYNAVLNGIVAEFDGVVSELDTVEGAPVQEGTKLIVLESFEEICVEFQASKYDLEVLQIGQKATIDISGKIYDGTVSKIYHMAEENSSGTPMVTAQVHINNPDDNIYLGIEAKINILTASESNALQVPVEAVNVDNNGEFCYIVENGVLVKKYIKTGISSEMYIQIVEGLSEGDEIVISSAMGVDLSEGMSVMVWQAPTNTEG